MKVPGYQRLSFSLLVLVCFSSAPVVAQVTPRWFDINPSRSNGDNNSASGGRINHVGAAADFSRVYAATEWGGLYTSFDQGNTWVKINTFAPSVTWDVKVDPANNRRVYASSFYDGRAVNPQSGISVSSDAGSSWSPVSFPTFNLLNCAIASAKTEPTGWQIAIDPTNTANVFVGTNCGLARSTNSGSNWGFVDPSPGDNAEQVFAVIAVGNQVVDVISSNGHFRSIDNGTNWSPVPSPALPGPVATNSGPGSTIAVSPVESSVLLAANGTNIWESDNGGGSWPTSLTLPLRSGSSNVQGRIPFVKTNQLTSTQFDIWYGDVNLFKATANTPTSIPPGTTGGPRAPLNSWSNMQEDAHWDTGDVMFDPRFTAGACPRLFTSDGGVYRNSGVNNPGCQNPDWGQPTITPHATWLWSMDGRISSGRQHAITYGLQDDGGWAATNVVEGHNPPAPNWNNYTCCDISDNEHDTTGLFMDSEGFSNQGRVIRVRKRNPDGGGDSEIPNYPSAGTFTPFSAGKGIARFGPDAFAVNPSDGVYFTNKITDNPIAWTSLNLPLTATSNAGSIKVANLGGRPNVYFHSGDGNESSPGSIFISTMLGTTAAPGSNWSLLNLPPGIGSVTVYDVDPNNGRRIVISGINSASNNFEMWMTESLGANWNRLTQLDNLMVGNSPDGSGTNVFKNFANRGRVTRSGGGTFNFGTSWQPSLLKFDPLDPTTIIAGAVDAGVFLSLNNGASWQLISTPINPNSTTPHIPRPLFAYFSPGRFNASTASFDVWVGTRGAGVMKVVVDQRRGD
ncbi:MAG TPA: hypothetical protein VKB46_13550 [Pyrinomonadaceae bacterium]|nr:hypothetical protein [Pyrinomonadaceae bacterium]